jgi:WD40 repeat protein
MTFSRDGTFFASGHLDGAIYVWQFESGLELEVALRHEGAVAGLGFTPDAATLTSGGMDSCLKLWEVPAALAGEARRMLRHQPAPVTCLAVDAAGRFVATGHQNRAIRVHDLESGRLQATLHGHKQAPSTLLVAAGGDVIASGSRDGSIRIFRLDSRQQTAVLTSHTRSVGSLAFFPDGHWLASVALDNALVIWDVTSGVELTTLTGTVGESFVSVCVVDQGQTLLCGLADGRIKVWSAV